MRDGFDGWVATHIVLPTIDMMQIAIAIAVLRTVAASWPALAAAVLSCLDAIIAHDVLPHAGAVVATVIASAGLSVLHIPVVSKMQTTTMSAVIFLATATDTKALTTLHKATAAAALVLLLWAFDLNSL